MSGIHGVRGTSPASSIVGNKPVTKSVSADAPKQMKITDKVQISGLLATLKAGGDIRADKVAAIKKQIEAGSYETGAKMDAAIDRLIDDLGR
jgi:anti-sigma28 factor (negative regulator of flagellin synthesis)